LCVFAHAYCPTFLPPVKTFGFQTPVFRLKICAFAGTPALKEVHEDREVDHGWAKGWCSKRRDLLSPEAMAEDRFCAFFRRFFIVALRKENWWQPIRWRVGPPPPGFCANARKFRERFPRNGWPIDHRMEM